MVQLTAGKNEISLESLEKETPESLQSQQQRLSERCTLLERRLNEIQQAQNEFEILRQKEIGRQRAAAHAASKMLNRLRGKMISLPKDGRDLLPPELEQLHVDFFKPILFPNTSIQDILPWDSMTLLEQEKELALVMCDPYVHLEAMRQNVVMPFDITTLGSSK